MGSIKVTLDGLEGCAMQFHTIAITLEDLKSSMDNVFCSVDSKIKRRRNIDGSIADIQKSMKALYTEIENIGLFISSSKNIYEKMELRLSRESQFNPFNNLFPNSCYGVWWNGVPKSNEYVGEAVQGRGEMPNPFPVLIAWYQDLEKGTKVFFGNACQVAEGITCGVEDVAKELVYGVVDIGKSVYNLGRDLDKFMMDDPFGKSEAWIKQNGSKVLQNYVKLKWGGELLPKLWDLSQNEFIKTKNKFEKADLKTKSEMATDVVVNLLLIFIPASKISKIGKSAEIVEGLSKVEKSAETVSKISLAEKEVKAVESISKVEKEAEVVEGLTKTNRSVREAEIIAKRAGEAGSRISYSKYFKSELKNFNKGFKIKNVVEEDMILVQFHSDAAVGSGRSLKFWTTAKQANKIFTIDEYMDKMALLSEWGERGTVSVSKIPAGTKVKYAIGTAREQAYLVTGEVRNGGGLQILFDEFNPNWVVQTRKIP